jgi:hypothetical protein
MQKEETNSPKHYQRKQTRDSLTTLDADELSHDLLELVSTEEYFDTNVGLLLTLLKTNSIIYNNSIVTALSKFILSEALRPNQRYRALIILIKITQTHNQTAIRQLAAKDAFLGKLLGVAAHKEKSGGAKGSTFFSKKREDELIGINFVRLVGEAIQYWGEEIGVRDAKHFAHPFVLLAISLKQRGVNYKNLMLLPKKDKTFLEEDPKNKGKKIDEDFHDLYQEQGEEEEGEEEDNPEEDMEYEENEEKLLNENDQENFESIENKKSKSKSPSPQKKKSKNSTATYKDILRENEHVNNRRSPEKQKLKHSKTELPVPSNYVEKYAQKLLSPEKSKAGSNNSSPAKSAKKQPSDFESKKKSIAAELEDSNKRFELDLKRIEQLQQAKSESEKKANEVPSQFVYDKIIEVRYPEKGSYRPTPIKKIIERASTAKSTPNNESDSKPHITKQSPKLMRRDTQDRSPDKASAPKTYDSFPKNPIDSFNNPTAYNQPNPFLSKASSIEKQFYFGAIKESPQDLNISTDSQQRSSKSPKNVDMKLNQLLQNIEIPLPQSKKIDLIKAPTPNIRSINTSHRLDEYQNIPSNPNSNYISTVGTNTPTPYQYKQEEFKYRSKPVSSMAPSEYDRNVFLDPSMHTLKDHSVAIGNNPFLDDLSSIAPRSYKSTKENPSYSYKDRDYNFENTNQENEINFKDFRAFASMLPSNIRFSSPEKNKDRLDGRVKDLIRIQNDIMRNYEVQGKDISHFEKKPIYGPEDELWDLEQTVSQEGTIKDAHEFRFNFSEAHQTQRSPKKKSSFKDSSDGMRAKKIVTFGASPSTNDNTPEKEDEMRMFLPNNYAIAELGREYKPSNNHSYEPGRDSRDFGPKMFPRPDLLVLD